jgi:hypothetical protein
MLDALKNVVFGFQVGIHRCVIVESPFKIVDSDALIIENKVESGDHSGEGASRVIQQRRRTKHSAAYKPAPSGWCESMSI